jgi:hypothetical protein
MLFSCELQRGMGTEMLEQEHTAPRVPDVRTLRQEDRRDDCLTSLLPLHWADSANASKSAAPISLGRSRTLPHVDLRIFGALLAGEPISHDVLIVARDHNQM